MVHERRVTAAEEEPDIDKLSSGRIILYLRSFVDDENAGTLPLVMDIDSGGSYECVPWYQTEEEQVKAVMNEFGYFLAIRKPNDAFPHSGASRLQVGHEWQEKVGELMAKSLFVVIRLGTTDGLLWELTTAVQHLEPCRLLLLVPFDKKEYNSFCNQHQDVFPKSLPSYKGGRECGSLRGIIWFQEDWTPEFITLETSELYLPKQSLQSALKVSLLPFIDRLKIPYLPLQVSELAIFKLLFIGFMACIFWSIIILNFLDLPLWWGIPAVAINSIISAGVYAQMREHFCRMKRFPGKY